MSKWHFLFCEGDHDAGFTLRGRTTHFFSTNHNMLSEMKTLGIWSERPQPECESLTLNIQYLKLSVEWGALTKGKRQCCTSCCELQRRVKMLIFQPLRSRSASVWGAFDSPLTFASLQNWFECWEGKFVDTILLPENQACNLPINQRFLCIPG